MLRGRFITLEGIEGVGKTTCVQFLAQRLTQAGIPHICTREPGGTPLAEQIRSLIVEPRDEPVTSVTELLLVFAARAQHLRNVIGPALDRGEWVLCDRFTDATYAYQGGGRGVDADDIAWLERRVQGDLRPDRVLLLDVDVPTALTRAHRRAIAADRFERERETFFTRVRQAYLDRAAADPGRWRVIDARGDLDSVRSALGLALDEWIGQACHD